MTTASFSSIGDQHSDWGAPPILLIADSESAQRRGRFAFDAAGLAISASVTFEEAGARLDLQARTGTVWVEIDGPPESIPMPLLRRIDEAAGRGEYDAIFAGPTAVVDELSAAAFSGTVELLIDADDADRIASLAIVNHRRNPDGRLSDIATDGSTARLRQLSDEVNRIAAALARLSSTPAPESTSKPVAPGEGPQIPAEAIRSIIRARRIRGNHFPPDLFADPAWDMMLDLLQAEIVQHRVPVSSLCIAAAVPATTALRWIKTMTDRGLLVRRDDPHDGRRRFIEMSPSASAALRSYFAEVGKVTVS